MIMKANKQIGFIYKNNESIDKILKDGDVVFEKGFLRELTNTTLPITFGGVGKDLKDYRVYGNTVQKILPDGYTQVDYIESNGTQYIDTGINADTKLRTILDISFISPTSANQTMGAINIGTPNKRYHLLSSSKSIAFWVNNTNYTIINTAITDRHLWDLNVPEGKVVIDETTTTTIPTNIDDTELNFWLFGRNSNSTQYKTSFKLWACKMYYNGTLVRDFIPCYRNTDNEVGLYDLVNNVFYTNQGTGSFTYGSVAPTPDAPIDIVSCGDRTKNLISFDDLNETTTNGVTYSIKNNIFTLNGTASANIRYIYANKYSLGSEGNYALKIDAISGSWTAGTIGISSRKVDETQQARFQQVTYSNTDNLTNIKNYSTAEIKETNSIGFFINSGSVFSNFKFRIIFNEGSTAIDYEPYGYKIPVNVRSKNLFDKNNVTLGKRLDSNGIFYNDTDYYTTSYIEIDSSTQYTKNSPSENAYHRICFYDNNNNFISASNSNTHTTPSNAKYIRFCGLQTELNSAMYVIGSTVPSKYIPYYNQTTNIYLNEPLRKIDDYSDYIDFKNGKIIRQLGEITLGGNEDIVRNNTNTTGKYRFSIGITNANMVIVSSSSTTSQILSNRFLPSNRDNSYNNINGICYGTGSSTYKNLIIYDESLSLMTVENFKTWLQSNNVTVDYVLLTPIEELITLPNIPTIDGNNTLNIETEITPSQVYIKYKSNE